MSSDPSKKAFERQTILLVLEAAGTTPVPIDDLQRMLPLKSVRMGFTEIEKELDYLLGKGLVQAVTHDLSAGFRRWKLTATGRELLESEGLA